MIEPSARSRRPLRGSGSVARATRVSINPCHSASETSKKSRLRATSSRT
jgi:hypothetical protein